MSETKQIAALPDAKALAAKVEHLTNLLQSLTSGYEGKVVTGEDAENAGYALARKVERRSQDQNERRERYVAKPIDSTDKPEMIDKSDLETIEAYFAVCFECESYTTPAKEEWHEAAADAMDAGWRVINGDVYCGDCKGLVLQRIEEVEGIRG